ncbi:MAG: cytochrome c oxidase subunit II [Bryobacterales bacterium]|nr:cytochrome c oxidase subunit II [Bryobacterales bacterium]
MNWLRELMMPVTQASDYAREVDNIYMFITYFGIFFYAVIVFGVGYFVYKYRRRRQNEETPDITHNTALEIIWTVIPSIPLVVMAFWGFNTYMQARVAPADALEIKVIAKKWAWEFTYPNGMSFGQEMHVPAGRPVKLVMISQDVIHDFYLPDFRIKADIVPNRYTQLWFNADEPGEHQVFCAEYCGRDHSNMLAKVVVDTEEQYQQWLEQKAEEAMNMPLPELGKLLYVNKGCNTCHSIDGTRIQGPSFKGIWGQTHQFSNAAPAVVDENYIRESLLQPTARVRAGYEAIMPSFQGLLREREIQALAEYVKSLK